MKTIPADLFFARIVPGQRFRVWPPPGKHNIVAGLILTATSPPTEALDDLAVSFLYPEWTGRGEGAVWHARAAIGREHFELIDDNATAVDVCGCGKPGDRHPDPYLLAEGHTAAAVSRPMLLCPTCLVQVTALAHAD